MRVYLSGPMGGLPDHNFPAFARAAARLRDMNYEVVSPHEIKHKDNGVPGSIAWGDYLRQDLIEMLTCDGIIIMPGWERSRGATLELHVATQVGMSVQELWKVVDYVSESNTS